MAKQMNSEKQNKRIVESNDGTSARDVVARGLRIKEVRVKSGLTAAEFAARCGVTEATQFNYEKGNRQPDAQYFASMRAEFLVCLDYVISGEPSTPIPSELTQDGAELLRRFEALPVAARDAVEKVLLLAYLATQDRAAYHEGEARPPLINPARQKGKTDGHP